MPFCLETVSSLVVFKVAIFSSVLHPSFALIANISH